MLAKRSTGFPLGPCAVAPSDNVVHLLAGVCVQHSGAARSLFKDTDNDFHVRTRRITLASSVNLPVWACAEGSGPAQGPKPLLKSVPAIAATVIAARNIVSADNKHAATIRGDGADTTAGAADQRDGWTSPFCQNCFRLGRLDEISKVI